MQSSSKSLPQILTDEWGKYEHIKYSETKDNGCFLGCCAVWSVRSSPIALMMEAASNSETSVNFYQTTRCNNLEDSHRHTRRRENLKSHTVKYLQGSNGTIIINIRIIEIGYLELFDCASSYRSSGRKVTQLSFYGLLLTLHTN
jgi:hypothetical protein